MIITVTADEEKELKVIFANHPAWSKRLQVALESPKSQFFANSDIENIKLTERIHELENEVKSLRQIIES